MISWSMTLTGYHIQILRALREDPSMGKWHALRTHTGHMRLLTREGLIEWKGKNEPYRSGYTGPWITKRGEFILDMVEKDISKYLSVTKAKTLKLAVSA